MTQSTNWKSRISSKISHALNELRRLIREYPRAFKLVWQADCKYTVFLLGLTALTSVTVPVQIWLTKLIIDAASALITGSQANPTKISGSILILVFLVLAVWILANAVKIRLYMVQDVLGLKVQYHVQYLIIQKASGLDAVFYETPRFYDMLENARRAAGSKPLNVMSRFSTFLEQGLSLVAMLVILGRLHPLAPVVLLLLAGPWATAESYFARHWYGLYTGQARDRRMAGYLSGLMTQRDAYKEIRLFGLKRLLLGRFRRFAAQFVAESRKLAISEQYTRLGLTTLSVISAGAIWLYAILQVVAVRITMGDLVLYFQAAQSARNSLETFLSQGGYFYEDTLFLTNLFAFLDLDPSSVEGTLSKLPTKTEALHIPRPIKKGVEFRNVSFKYPRTERFVLRDVSFHLSVGDVMAIVGENGVGKTTIVKLLTRLYDPSEGVILLDGKPLQEYDLDDLHSQIGVIFQDFVKYNLPVRENIGFGQIDKLEDISQIRLAADKGGAIPIIEKLSQGFETYLGVVFDDGVDLSVGEWQKIALSRAFMREAQILILDEPTASLDALAEYEIFQRFSELTHGKTTVFISHRFSSVRMADHILVLKDGRCIEEGSHQQLLKLGGTYAQMFNTQAERYK